MITMSFYFKVPDAPLFRGEGAAVLAEQINADVEWGVNLALGAVLPSTPVGVTGNLRGGVQSEVIVGGVETVGRVFDPIPYATPIDQGTEQFFPPSDALIPWVIKVLDVAPKQAKSVAFLVARAISRRGIAARGFFSNNWKKVKPQIKAHFEEGLASVKARLVGK